MSETGTKPYWIRRMARLQGGKREDKRILEHSHKPHEAVAGVARQTVALRRSNGDAEADRQRGRRLPAG